jgi:uncharacterized protein YecE (DUF72 family)
MTKGKGRVRVGCCGFRSSRESYYELLDSVEVQHTFYQPPQVSTLGRWKEEAPAGFEFTLKAWQLITHLASSPTYRRLRRPLTEEQSEGAGFFRPTEAVDAAWELTRECAAALKARAVLFQCPASFKPTSENVENMRRFFRRAVRGRLVFAWEPRGGWPRELVKELCDELKLWHAVDPFAERSVTPGKCYFRLHGRRGWRYKYEDAELEELSAMLPKRATSYVFFNNVEMRDDARRFRQIVESGD